MAGSRAKLRVARWRGIGFVFTPFATLQPVRLVANKAVSESIFRRTVERLLWSSWLGTTRQWQTLTMSISFPETTLFSDNSITSLRSIDRYKKDNQHIRFCFFHANCYGFYQFHLFGRFIRHHLLRCGGKSVVSNYWVTWYLPFLRWLPAQNRRKSRWKPAGRYVRIIHDRPG